MGTRFLCYEVYMCLQNRDRGGFSRLSFLNGAMILHLMSAVAQEERPVSVQTAFQCSNIVWRISGQRKSFIPSIWHGDGHLTEERESLGRQSPKMINVSSKSLLKSSRGWADSTLWVSKWQSGLFGVLTATLSYLFLGNWNQKNMIIDFFLLCCCVQSFKNKKVLALNQRVCNSKPSKISEEELKSQKTFWKLNLSFQVNPVASPWHLWGLPEYL